VSKHVGYEACPRCRSNGRDNRGDNLARYGDGSGHCFSCGYHEHSSINSLFHEPVNDVPKHIRPPDFQRNGIPARALQWLLQYGLPYSYWQDTIGWSERFQRLVFEVTDNEVLLFSIGRYFGEEGKRKWHVWGDCHKHCHVVQGNAKDDHGAVVLVEDWLSAHKAATSEYVAAAIPLFGVSVHNAHMYYLINSTSPVVLWLDKDQELPVKRRALALGSVLGRTVNVVNTDDDPKLLSTDTINNIIKGLYA